MTSTASNMNHRENHEGVHNSQHINEKVAEVLSKLKKGHTRRDAFAAINEANIRDRNGKPVIPSVWYHSLCYVTKASGKTFMEERYPKFVPTESPYKRPEREHKEVVKPQKANNDEVIQELMKSFKDTINELRFALEGMTKINADLLESFNGLRKEMVEIMAKPQVQQKKVEAVKAKTETKPETKGKTEVSAPKKDNAIHATIHKNEGEMGKVAA